MPTANQVLFQALRRSVRDFQKESIPFTGLVNSNLTFWSLDPVSTITALFKTPQPDTIRFEDGVKLLPGLRAQYETLLNCEEHTREAMAEWSSLINQHRINGQVNNPLAAAIAAEQGMELLCKQIEDVQDPVLQYTLDTANDNDDDTPSSVSLDELAEQVAAQESGLFPPSNPINTDTANDESRLQRQLQALTDVVYKQQKFRHMPFEWVYEGLSPLVLEDVLKNRKGSPTTLAMITTSVARRLGIPLMPFPLMTPMVHNSDTSDGQTTNIELPPELAVRLANRTQAIGPDPSPWLLELNLLPASQPDDGGLTMQQQQRGSKQGRMFIDASTGDLLSPEAVHDRYPSHTRLLHRQASKDTSPVLVAGDGPSWSPLVSWRGLVRTLVQAHQRRGESDMVAHWLYILLALDTGALEWSTMLQGPELLVGSQH